MAKHAAAWTPPHGTHRLVQPEDQLRQGLGPQLYAPGHHGLSLLGGGALQPSAVTVPAAGAIVLSPGIPAPGRATAGQDQQLAAGG